MDIIERSLKNRQIQNNFSISGVGYLRYEDRDAIPQAADFLVTEENIHTAVVYGIIHDQDNELEVVIGSLRTNKLTLDPDEFLKEALGKDSQGRYYAEDGKWLEGLKFLSVSWEELTIIPSILSLNGKFSMLRLNKNSYA